MRRILFFLLALPLFIMTCGDDDGFQDIAAPQNLTLSVTIAGQTEASPFGDGSGEVTFSAAADNAIRYRYEFSDGSGEFSTSGQINKRFTRVGVNAYDITLTAFGTDNSTAVLTEQITVEVIFSDPEALDLLAGDGSKTWYWAFDETGHLGVGQNDDDPSLNAVPNFYRAAPYEKDGPADSDCLYHDEMTFSRNGDALFFQLNNFGQTYFNVAYVGVAGGSADIDFCYDFSVNETPTPVEISPAESLVTANGVPGQTRGTSLVFSNDAFMSYYVGATTYEILSLSEDKLVVRAVQGNNTDVAWYHTFTTTRPAPIDAIQYDNLVWSDEFETDGPPNPDNWDYNLGQGQNGWGNGESQFYTDDPENVRVEDGLLKITAIRENVGSASFTSARLVTENKYEFTYGRIDISAKLPSGGGTWPALWALGEDYATNTWPACGEIDVMEHVGNQQNEIHSSLHFPGNSGGDARTRSIIDEDVSEEFHTYSCVWSPDAILFYIDGQRYHTFLNSPGLPYHSDFFLIFNLAMGGNFGGEIDPAFQTGTMEVDWVRVYQ